MDSKIKGTGLKPKPSQTEWVGTIQQVIGRNLTYVKAPEGTLVVKDMMKFVSEIRDNTLREVGDMLKTDVYPAFEHYWEMKNSGIKEEMEYAEQLKEIIENTGKVLDKLKTKPLK